jgi:hypothetical protein
MFLDATVMWTSWSYFGLADRALCYRQYEKVRLYEMAFVSRQGFYSKSLAAWHEIHFFGEFILVQVYEKCKYTNRTLKFPLSGYIPAMLSACNWKIQSAFSIFGTRLAELRSRKWARETGSLARLMRSDVYL